MCNTVMHVQLSSLDRGVISLFARVKYNNNQPDENDTFKPITKKYHSFRSLDNSTMIEYCFTVYIKQITSAFIAISNINNLHSNQ